MPVGGKQVPAAAAVPAAANGVSRCRSCASTHFTSNHDRLNVLLSSRLRLCPGEDKTEGFAGGLTRPPVGLHEALKSNA